MLKKYIIAPFFAVVRFLLRYMQVEASRFYRKNAIKMMYYFVHVVRRVRASIVNKHTPLIKIKYNMFLMDEIATR